MRNLGLDLLRLFAVVLVLGRHLSLPTKSGIFLDAWRTGGWVGVDLFFVLSGFLISGLLFREYQQQGRIHLKRFLVRRGFKIYPPYYVLVAVTLFVFVSEGRPISNRHLLGTLFFLNNYLGGLWGHL